MNNAFESLAPIITLGIGSHADRSSNKVCAMEFAAWLAGEPHSDKPLCVSPLIRGFMISWNDRLRSDDERKRLLLDLIPLTLNTADAHDERRRWMLRDWLYRVCLPQWLELTPELVEYAIQLRALPEVTAANATLAGGLVLKAREAASVQRGKAYNKIRSAIAAFAAYAAAAYAAYAAAADAAYKEIYNQVHAAVTAKLAPTREAVQQSARELVKRLCEVGR